MKTIIVPIDNRPVTYLFPQLVAAIAGVQTIAPPREMMGSLKAHSDIDAVEHWLSETLKREQPDALLVCLDTILYGGLIPSRRGTETAAQILERAKRISAWKKLSPKTAIYAQSSIMRISDNYDNTEEKAYWARYGREIFAWSEAMHRLAGDNTAKPGGTLRPGELNQLEAHIPEDIRQDYLNTRRRNFQLNRKLIDYVESGDLDFLIYSQDDSGEFGLNVLEKQRLTDEAARRHLKRIASYAGADEVLMTLLGRWLINRSEASPLGHLAYSPANGASITSRYEGQKIGESVAAQLAAIGIKTSTDPQNAELQIVIHTSGDRQGDHIHLPGHADLRNLNTTEAVNSTLQILREAQQPVILCDLAYANGADPLLIRALLQEPHLFSKLCGYAGWNTSGNSLGSALAMGIAAWFARRNNISTDQATRQALFVRLADDWAYQSEARKQLSAELSLQELRTLMSPHLGSLLQALQISMPELTLSLPWQRSFEIEIGFPQALQQI